MIFKYVVTREQRRGGYPLPSRLLGLAYHCFDRDATVYYIVPVNLIIAFARWLSERLKWVWAEGLQQFEEATYTAGWRAGYKCSREQSGCGQDKKPTSPPRVG